MAVPFQFANTPNGSTIPLAKLDQNFDYVENQINSLSVVTSFSGGSTGLLPATASTGIITLTGRLNVANGGTGATTASGAMANLLPAQTGQNGKFLTTDGNGNLSWAASGAGGVTGIANGGTGLTATPTNGQLLIGNGTGYTLATLTGGTGITIANTAGGITINATGGGGGTGTVTSVGLTSNLNGITITPSTAITTSGSFALGGTLGFANGGTGLSTLGTNGQVLTSNGTAIVWASAGAASNTFTNGISVSGTFSGSATILGSSPTQVTYQHDIGASVGVASWYTTPTFTTLATSTATLVLSATSPTVTINNGLPSQFRFPATTGTSGQVLTTDGTGVTSWASAGAASNTFTSGISVSGTFSGSATILGTSPTQVTYQHNAGSQIGAGSWYSTPTFTSLATPTATLVLSSNSPTVTINNGLPSQFRFPATTGTSGQVLTTDGTGVTSWASSSGNTFTNGISVSGTFSGSATILGTSPTQVTYQHNVGALVGAGSWYSTPTFTTLATPTATLVLSSNSPTVQVNTGLPSQFVFPSSGGSSGQVLQTNGSGITSWTSVPTLGATNTWSGTNNFQAITSTDITVGPTGSPNITLNSSGTQYGVYASGGAGGFVAMATPSGNTGFLPNTAGAGFTATGPYTNSSDATLKENISPVGACLDKVKALEGVYFSWIEDQTHAQQIGLIAQDVQQVVPEVVSRSVYNDKLGIAYASLVPVLINAIKELEARVAALEAK